MFSLSFDTDNIAFTEAESPTEIARILRALADRIEEADLEDQEGIVQDRNGNTVGTFEMTAPNWTEAEDDTSWD